MTARERREHQRRCRFAAHILIIVVALIECLVLLSFTTYSWIESSSSLIISSGKDGRLNMAVAKNINYQVLFSFSSEENVSLSPEATGDESDADGYYRTVENFSYAKATTPDGKTFFFKRPASLGLTGAAAYRSGDTADYNTSYTYLDFVMKNTTGATKGFFFEPNTSRTIFQIDNKSSFSHADDVVYETYTAEQVIINAMRLSFTKNNTTPLVFSVNGNNSDSPVNAAGAAVSTPLASQTIASREYSEEGTTAAVFESLGNEGTSKISIRVWFDENDAVYSGLSAENREIVDAILYAAKIELNFRLINDTIPYSLVYFDDYAFSDTKTDRFVTQENSTYSMYFHAYNSKTKDFVNYPMSIDENEDNDAVRWSTSIPIPFVVDTLLDTTTPASVTDAHNVVHANVYNETYFFYGSVADATATPSEVAYKWSMPGAFITADSDSDGETDTINNNTFRNLGVVRTNANKTQPYVSDYVCGTSAEPVNGFLQFDSSDAMTLVNFRDRATGLTGQSYNANDGASNIAYGYITASRTSDSLGDFPIDYSKLYYFDVPQSAELIIISNGSGGGMDQTEDITSFSDGECFHLQSAGSTSRTVSTVTSVSLPTAMSRGLVGYKRIYFLNDQNNSSPSWSDPKMYQQSEVPSSFPGESMTLVDAPSSTRQVDRMYINRTAVSANGADATQAATAKSTVSMRYNTTKKLWQAYVPASWLTTDGTYFHYNGRNVYYNDYTESVYWAAGVASIYNGADYIYTALGYTDAASIYPVMINAEEVSGVTCGTGVGTWGDVRKISFTTELIDSSTGSSTVYKVGTGSGQYPMYLDDDMNMTFSAYVPVTGLDTQGTTPVLRYTRYAAFNNSAVTGTWYPQENITNSEVTYYATDVTAAAEGASSADRGWYHVAVIVDGTFENLIYDTTLGTESATSHGYLSYSFNGSDYTKIADSYNSINSYLLAGDNTRWAIPLGSNTYVYVEWAPYPATSTVFNYEFDISRGIYYVVTEASGL